MHEFEQPIQAKSDPLGSLALLNLDYALAASVVEEYEFGGAPRSKASESEEK